MDFPTDIGGLAPWAPSRRSLGRLVSGWWFFENPYPPATWKATNVSSNHLSSLGPQQPMETWKVLHPKIWVRTSWGSLVVEIYHYFQGFFNTSQSGLGMGFLVAINSMSHRMPISFVDLANFLRSRISMSSVVWPMWCNLWSVASPLTKRSGSPTLGYTSNGCFWLVGSTKKTQKATYKWYI